MGRTRRPDADRAEIYLNTAELDALFNQLDIAGFRRKAEHLHIGRSTLHRAYQGSPVGADLIAAVRTTFPRVSYARLFRERAVREAAA